MYGYNVAGWTTSDGQSSGIPINAIKRDREFVLEHLDSHQMDRSVGKRNGAEAWKVSEQV